VVTKVSGYPRHQRRQIPEGRTVIPQGTPPPQRSCYGSVQAFFQLSFTPPQGQRSRNGGFANAQEIRDVCERLATFAEGKDPIAHLRRDHRSAAELHTTRAGNLPTSFRTFSNQVSLKLTHGPKDDE